MLTINLEDKNYKKSLDKKFKTSVIEAFEKYGLLKFTNVKNEFIKFVNQFTHSFANDARRRQERMNDKNIRNVDGGKKKIYIFRQPTPSTRLCPYFHTAIYGSPVALPKARNGPRSGSRGSNQCLWCATSRNGSAFGSPIGITRPPAQEGQTGMRGHCWMSPARLEAVFWAADAAIGVATAETAAPDATVRRVNVPGFRSTSGNFSQFFCERAAAFAATARSRTRRGIVQGAAQT